MSAPIIEGKILPSDINYHMVSFVGSLYKALMENNMEIEGFMLVCPELSTFAYVVANRILEYYYRWRRRDFSKEIIWDVFDHWDSKDLMIMGYIPLLGAWAAETFQYASKPKLTQKILKIARFNLNHFSFCLYCLLRAV